MSTLVGGCQCGQVRYESNAQPLFSGNCHCRECQRVTGGAYVPAFAVPANALKITGEVKYYESRADSGALICVPSTVPGPGRIGYSVSIRV